MTRKYAYIAKKPCGCIVMATMDTPAPNWDKDSAFIRFRKKEIAKEVALAIRQGYTIHRVTSDYVRNHWECKRHEREKTAKLVLNRLKGS